MKRVLFCSTGIVLFGCLGAGLLFLTCAGVVYPIEFIFTIATGWFTFLHRVVPQVEVDGGAIALGCTAFGIFVIGLHVLLRYFYTSYQRRDVESLAHSQDNWGKQSASEVPPNLDQPWRFRWTICISSVVLLMFSAGIAFVGVTHQTIWLATSPESLLESNRPIMESENQLRRIGVAIHAYEDASLSLPPGMTSDAEGRQLHSWMTLILPMMEQRAVYDRIDRARAWDDPVQGKVFETQLRQYQSPYPQIPERCNAQGRSLAHYSSNVYLLGGTAVRTQRDISDGTANTILAGEAGGNYVAWGKPGNWRDPRLGINQSPAGFGGPLVKGAMFVFADGRVQYLSNQTSPEVLRALATPAGGEVVPEE